jgi:hypothetical protein
MPLFSSENWRRAGAPIVVELLIVVVLGFAVVRYVEWSSDVNLAEFMSATETSAHDSTPVQSLKGRTGCDRDKKLRPAAASNFSPSEQATTEVRHTP